MSNKKKEIKTNIVYEDSAAVKDVSESVNLNRLKLAIAIPMVLCTLDVRELMLKVEGIHHVEVEAWVVVTEYSYQFHVLGRYTPTIMNYPDEKMIFFWDGLLSEIQTQITVSGIRTFDWLFEAACDFNGLVGHPRGKTALHAGDCDHINILDSNNFWNNMRIIVVGIHDSEYPLCVDFICLLHSIFEVCNELEEIRPIILLLQNETWNLTNEIENEDLLFTFETIVDKFEDEMTPYALGLCMKSGVEVQMVADYSSTSDNKGC
ncbi:hypothetical protein ACH5RR_017770 [Cinchona calisaya]|uniref:Uncharacterized protein n=1 Tax=Cinchona calisaya TaxID=153742 RepID=A0ABD2ZJI4_9GENT